MDYGKTLPVTGAGVSAFGIYIGQLWLIAVAVGLVAAGAVLMKLTFRRGKKADHS
ncbi:hypothetical protein [Actinomadura sp. KC06]|uniref:hypothetical protein n=1 Tax=Actinomadura sp. KC06 TaxID=2530369 RepID=UPI00140519F6|nr:hypothetical protein [Actinomadura sp. KC06]